jgi:hypothetical protein
VVLPAPGAAVTTMAREPRRLLAIRSMKESIGRAITPVVYRR